MVCRLYDIFQSAVTAEVCLLFASRALCDVLLPGSVLDLNFAAEVKPLCGVLHYKYICIRHHHLHYLVNTNRIVAKHVSSHDMPADLLTKPLPKQKIQYLCTALKIVLSPSSPLDWHGRDCQTAPTLHGDVELT